MDFKQKELFPKNEEKYHFENLRISRNFTKKLIEEMGDLVRSVVLFGSNTQNTLNKDSDIDIMIILNNTTVYVSAELKEAYHIITKKLIQEISPKIHLLSVNLSDLWDMARKGDPILINILRYGMPIFDRDLIDPMQYLLEIGKIRPTKESIENYSSRANTLLEESDNHIKEALLDLYYGVIDQVHATLMVEKITPPSPREMPKIFKETFKEKKSIIKYSSLIEEFYQLSKNIEHNKKENLNGIYYDKMKKKAKDLILNLQKYNKKEMSKKDFFEL